MSKKLLVVVDYQNDFVDGALGFEKSNQDCPLYHFISKEI